MTMILITTMIAVSTALRFIQEHRSTEAAERLKAMVRNTVAVKRAGKIQETDIEKLVLGDVVHLAAGDMIPADLRIITTKDLFVNQATLTGESEPVEKRPELPEDLKKTTIFLSLDTLHNICLMGTSVVSGSATGVVLATGSHTYLGSMAETIVGHREVTGFERGVRQTSMCLFDSCWPWYPLPSLLTDSPRAIGSKPFFLPWQYRWDSHRRCFP